jgi:hypothetical protein
MKPALSSVLRKVGWVIVRKTYVTSSTTVLLRDTDTTVELAGLWNGKNKKAAISRGPGN